jgi:hypothetical protein
LPQSQPYSGPSHSARCGASNDSTCLLMCPPASIGDDGWPAPAVGGEGFRVRKDGGGVVEGSKGRRQRAATSPGALTSNVPFGAFK